METTNVISKFSENFTNNSKVHDLQTADDWAFQRSSNSNTDWAADFQDIHEKEDPSSKGETALNDNSSLSTEDDFGDFTQNKDFTSQDVNNDFQFQCFKQNDSQSTDFQAFEQPLQASVSHSQRCKQILENCFSLNNTNEPSTIDSIHCLKSK